MTPSLQWRRVAAWVGGAVLSFCLLALLGVQLQMQRLERAVLDDWHALPAPPTTRPSHVEVPPQGTVGAAFLKALAEPHPPVPRTWHKGEPVECMQARDRPLAELPDACRQVIEAQAGWAKGVLAASRSTDATLTPELEGWRDTLEKPEAQRDALVLAVVVVSHEVRRAAARGEADAALIWCADGLGLARDMALRLGPTGAMFASYWTVLFTRPCGEAIDAASPAAKRIFAQVVDSIARALPADGPLLRQAVVERVVELYGASFEDSTLAALPASMVQRLHEKNPGAHRFLSPFQRRNLVREASALRSTLGAADGTPAERDAAFAVAKERLAAFSPRELKLDELFDRVDRLRLLLSLLSRAARLDAGDETAAGPGLALTEDGDAQLLAPASARYARHAVRLHKDSNSVAGTP